MYIRVDVIQLNKPDKFWLRFRWEFGLWSTFRWSGPFSHWRGRNHIKFPFTNKMYQENHAADRVLKLQWVTSPRHLVFECAKLRRPHSESRLPTWPLTFTPLLALSLLYVQLKNIVSATTTQHISVKGVARFCVSGQVIKSFFAYGRILKTTLKGKVIQLYILWTLKLWWVEHFYMFNQMVF